MNRQIVSTGTEWESRVGYSRAVRLGSHVHVSGTTATNEEGEFTGDDDPYEQAVQALANIENALHRMNATMNDVVRTRMYVTNVDNWEEVRRAHGEMFGDIPPTTSMVEVTRLIEPEMLVEIEAEALIVAQGTDSA
ncbi:RidA family protein [Saliphagus infecundisoli]|uniref:RidA family protein n=1 Tax=Saliphagus infecundisoli TaxID=1849069 RepID=A0ABD5QCH1_9EURY|nr:RidA family protein [Saliphagus infecundisoli]